MRKIMIVVLLVRQLQHGFTKNAKVSPNLTVAQICGIASRQKKTCMLMIDELHRIVNGADLLSDEFKRIIGRPKPISALVLVNKIMVNNNVINVCLRKILKWLDDRSLVGLYIYISSTWISRKHLTWYHIQDRYSS